MRRIYIKDKDALILLLQAIGFLLLLIIFDAVLWAILCGIGVIIVAAAHIFIVVLTGATIYAICNVSRDAIGFRKNMKTGGKLNETKKDLY